MRVGIISVYMDYRRKGAKSFGVPQPGAGPLIAALLPPEVEVDVVQETVEDPDWQRAYDLLFITCLHPDFDRARQISHYWRRRGAKTVLGGVMAGTYPGLCQPYFDAIVVGDAEGSVRQVYEDFCRGELKPRYVSGAYDPLAVPTPRLDLAVKAHLPLTLEATRGCPFACDFCALTAAGTRFHSRPPELVVRDIREGQGMLRGLIPSFKLRMVEFLDNNLGGSPPRLRALCAALRPLDIRWGGEITFNALGQPGMPKALADAGCRVMFVGLESLNPAALADMKKFQNVLDKTLGLIDRCRKNGILLTAGMLLSPTVDNWEYIRRIPKKLQEVGLYIPTFLCFEAPIPGTPYFNRLAAEPAPAFLPNALLRDFTGYTLVNRPQHETVEDFVGGYKWAMQHVYTPTAKLHKFVEDVPPLLMAGKWETALGDVVAHWRAGHRPHPERTYLAGTDTPPPEASNVPFTASDFSSEVERRAIIDPWRVTDEEGRVLPQWLHPSKVYGPRGVVLPLALGQP
ncbi:MAG: radical SAM protein [Chloroflexi bacterium]|nr:radical SAM protein [Chloroflexota bacterium]